MRGLDRYLLSCVSLSTEVRTHEFIVYSVERMKIILRVNVQVHDRMIVVGKYFVSQRVYFIL